MSQTIRTLLRHLRGTTDSPGNTTDADLLDRFVRNRAGAAFTALVVRYGPMVLGVCHRPLHDPHDAEDAFQATFLVLARRADTLGRSDSIGTWLYGVACRTAVHARVDRARRRTHERRAMARPPDEPTSAVEWADLRPVLDEEIQRLPEECRVLVVLCYLGGKTYDEAATETGCPKGTVATRLAKARGLLRDRLSGRGLTLPAAILAAMLAESARSVVAAPLLSVTVEAATTSVASAGVINLTERVLTIMSGSKLKTVVTVLVAVGLLAGTGVLAFTHGATPPVSVAKPDDGKPESKDAKPAVPTGLWQTGWLRIQEEGKDGRVLLFKPDGSMRAETVVHKTRRSALSPDGTHMLSVRVTEHGSAVFMTDVARNFEYQFSIGRLPATSPCWSADGKHIAYLGKVGGQWQVHETGGNGGEFRQITDLPNGAGMPSYSPDGQLTYLSYSKDQKADLVVGTGREANTVVAKTTISHYAWSPDGKMIAYGKPGALVFHDVDPGKEYSGKQKEVTFPSIDKRLDGHAARKIGWSPDGRAVVCSITFAGDRRQEGAKVFGDDELFVITPGGLTRSFQPGVSVQHLEWIELPARAAPGVTGLLKTVEGFRKELPPQANIGEMNGFSIKDADGKHVLLSHLNGVTRRLQVKTKGECLVLLTYLNDRDVRIRVVAAQAIEKVVGAYPTGMSLNDMTEIDTDGHREMIRRFVEKIDKLTE